jgi:hypothetical protein
MRAEDVFPQRASDAAVAIEGNERFGGEQALMAACELTVSP